jgi:hypothetical protein
MARKIIPKPEPEPEGTVEDIQETMNQKSSALCVGYHCGSLLEPGCTII